MNASMAPEKREPHSSPNGASSVRSWGVSHKGSVRPVNQDRFLARDDLGVWLVADGAGGHEGGGVAAQALVEEFGRLQAGLSNEAIVRECAGALQKTHLFLRALAGDHEEATGITTAAVLILDTEKLACQWVGDSRVYQFRNGQLTLLTHDHSLVQEMVDAGRITASESERHPQRNIITRAVGANCDTLQIATLTMRAEPGDLYLMCSDGLWGTLSQAQITAAFELSPKAIADALVDAALASHATDNVTAVVVSVPLHERCEQ